MKKNTYYLKRTLLLSTIVFMMGCETGVKNKQTQTVEAQSGIVDHRQINTSTKTTYSVQKSTLPIKKIFSNSATPGYYLQVGFFKQSKPNATFINRLNSSGFNYTILPKSGNYYALVGAYISYNQAKSNASAVKSALQEDSFVVQVLRP
ncbi:SPOR domain-containing protein [bacterium]|nr:SPOR domain-containing protein [bacterium]MBU1956860.1 SPOR domain-containing protein [bacterium]